MKRYRIRGPAVENGVQEGNPFAEGPYGDSSCSDNIDNDCDGSTDANDPDCIAPPETCDDGIDNNGNGLVDCADPQCDGSADQGVFVQRDVSLHHLYVHDTGGEGFYIGSTQSNGQPIPCDGTQEVHQPHYLEGIHVHHNIIERTGWDGAQIGMARSDCAFFANTDELIRRKWPPGVVLLKISA